MTNTRIASFLLAAAFGLIAGCATPDSAPASNTVELRDTAEGWVVTFSFQDPQEAVVLTQAPEPYRSDTWTPLTPGVSIEQFGEADFILFEEPAQTASFSVDPTTRSIRKAYTPFLSFTDGGWGVLEGQFRFATVDDVGSVAAYEGNGETWPGEDADYELVLASERSIYHDGRVAASPLTLSPEGDGRYIYVGDREFEVAQNYFGVVDRGLPRWIRDQLDDDLATIFGQLTDEWGIDLPERAEVLFVYDGADHPGLSQTGGAIGNQLALQVSGEALLEPDSSIVDFFRWFLAHESAHLYQSAAGMDDVPSEHAWMHEGGANTMAHRIGGRMASDRDAFLSEVYNAAITDCADYLEEGAPLVEAIETGRFDVYYACGDLIGLMTEAEMTEGDIFDFWTQFLATARDQHTGAISAVLYFEQAEAMGVPEAKTDWMRRFVLEPVESPRETLIEQLRAVGLGVTVGDDGGVTMENVPN